MSQGFTHSQALNTSPTDLPSHQMAWILSHLTISWACTHWQVTIPLWAIHSSPFGILLTMVLPYSYQSSALLSTRLTPQPQDPSWLSTEACFYDILAGQGLVFP